MRRDVRILLVGDEGVGKSTIVTSLIKESFVPHVQHVVPEVTIPPEVTPENVTTYIVDSGAGPHDRPHLESEIRKAHVICVVYSIDNPNSFDRIPAHWLPLFRQLGVNVPVILVGNKIDLRGGEVTNKDLEAEIVPIMNEFKEVETCVECSALMPLNVSEVFYFAQKAVLHPTAPLYDSREHVLKPACESALRRIFKLCDTTKDGILDAAELNEFQRKCFDAPLQSQEISAIHDMVLKHAAGGIRAGGLTEEGFLYLHTTFIQQGRLETTWTVLRRFGYAEDLRLREGFLSPKFDVPQDCSVELSPLGYQFFTDIFETYDKDKDGALKPSELEDLFSTSPGNPWVSSKGFSAPVVDVSSLPKRKRVVGALNDDGAEDAEGDDEDDENSSEEGGGGGEGGGEGAVTLQGWLAQWSMTTLLNPKLTLAYLAYLGFSSSPAFAAHATSSSSAFTTTAATSSMFSSSSSGFGSGSASGTQGDIPTTAALQVTRARKTDRKKGKVTRGVFLGYVCGAVGCGKSALLDAFAGRAFGEGNGRRKVRVVSGSGSWVGGAGGAGVGAGEKGQGKEKERDKERVVVNVVDIDGVEKYLVLQEIPSYDAEILRNPKKLELADVMVYVHDSSDTHSFSYISNLRAKYSLDHIPSLFVATKSDLDLAQQRHEVQPDVYCRRLGLPVPVAVSVKTGQTADVFHAICGVAMNPTAHLPGGADRAMTAAARVRMYFTLTAVIGGCSAGLMMFYRTYWRGVLGYNGLLGWVMGIIHGGGGGGGRK